MTKTWDSFTKFGSAIATFMIVISFHVLFFLNDPMQFLLGLITPSIILPMLALMCVALVVGYLIGTIPAYLTSQLFYQFLGDPRENMRRSHYLKCGVLVALAWSLLLILWALLTGAWIALGLFLFIVVFPTILICADLEWRERRKFAQQYKN
ncbi:hypothetical protein SAMN05421749_102366 [Acinetobacter marinus]|uniref:Uncharacterized protein n=1 Tax=Acinetobacter marinus TaxID=281375 RepID=A0A1G6HLC4_9GAMM|nr:hypothetical protein [Acinetobacter marinus]SDB94963.1 hypothetical protein SAMN05421749_102366 [Acinetobacter marinus]